jgi:hypothetical protein
MGYFLVAYGCGACVDLGSIGKVGKDNDVFVPAPDVELLVGVVAVRVLGLQLWDEIVIFESNTPARVLGVNSEGLDVGF